MPLFRMRETFNRECKMKRLGWNVSYILLLCSMTRFQTDHDIVSLLFTQKGNSAETCTRSTKQFLPEKPYEA